MEDTVKISVYDLTELLKQVQTLAENQEKQIKRQEEIEASLEEIEASLEEIKQQVGKKAVRWRKTKLC